MDFNAFAAATFPELFANQFPGFLKTPVPVFGFAKYPARRGPRMTKRPARQGF